MKNLDYYLNLPINETTATALALIEPEIGGGRISAARIDQIADYPAATKISISALTQPAFERFVQRFARQFRTIKFWKCPAVEVPPPDTVHGVAHENVPSICPS